jgi:hypothetical protein
VIFSLTQRVLAVSHQDDPADNLFAVLLEHAPAKGGPKLDRAEHANGDRCAGTALGDDRLADVIEILDPADRADQILGIPLVNHPPTGGRVRTGDGRVDFTQADAVGTELVRVEVNLVLAWGSADRGDLGHARHAA